MRVLGRGQFEMLGSSRTPQFGAKFASCAHLIATFPALIRAGSLVFVRGTWTTGAERHRKIALPPLTGTACRYIGRWSALLGQELQVENRGGRTCGIAGFTTGRQCARTTANRSAREASGEETGIVACGGTPESTAHSALRADGDVKRTCGAAVSREGTIESRQGACAKAGAKFQPCRAKGLGLSRQSLYRRMERFKHAARQRPLMALMAGAGLKGQH